MRTSFDEFVANRRSALVRFGYRLTGDTYLAEDIVQEALIRAYPHWSTIESSAGPESYVRKAVLHWYLSTRRRRASSEIVMSDPARCAVADGVVDRTVERQSMWQLLHGLPRAQRVVLVLRHYEDLPDEAIARVLGCAPATVRWHAFQGIRRLRAAMALN
jgi:RNA polymerase sigma-70 factor (sigma-E family)